MGSHNRWYKHKFETIRAYENGRSRRVVGDDRGRIRQVLLYLHFLDGNFNWCHIFAGWKGRDVRRIESWYAMKQRRHIVSSNFSKCLHCLPCSRSTERHILPPGGQTTRPCWCLVSTWFRGSLRTTSRTTPLCPPGGRTRQRRSHSNIPQYII